MAGGREATEETSDVPPRIGQTGDAFCLGWSG